MLVALTAVNVVIVLVAGYGALHSMESPSFCGQACHEPMHPQFTAWQAAPHSEVACVQCHIGEGGRAFVKYKMNGLRQLYHVVTRQIPRPIPGVADLRPAMEVCGTCHWSGKGFADVVRVKREYAEDETNTETSTFLQLFLGGPGAPTRSGRAIHWHADPRRANRIHLHRRRAPDHSVRQVHGCTRQRPRVRRRGHDAGTAREGHVGARWTASTAITSWRIASRRHRSRQWIAALAEGRIDRGLPFVRREGVRLMKSTYQTGDEAASVIDADLRKFYTSRGRCRRRTGHWCRDGAAGDLPPKRVSRDEGHVRHLSRQPRPHDVEQGVFVATTAACWPRTAVRSTRTASTATSSWRVADLHSGDVDSEMLSQISPARRGDGQRTAIQLLRQPALA